MIRRVGNDDGARVFNAPAIKLKQNFMSTKMWWTLKNSGSTNEL
mgnify:FL=1|jgi:hypothetical protein